MKTCCREAGAVVRTQIQLTEEQARALRALAGQQGVSIAEVIRRAVERVLQESEQQVRRKRALAVLGRYRAEPADISASHDRYLDEDFR